MPDYSNGKIYKITNAVNNDIYVGSTVQTLEERMRLHKVKAKIYPERKLYKRFFEIGFDNFTIELIEQYPCKNKDELETKEFEYIRMLKPVYNKNNIKYNQYEKDNFKKGELYRLRNKAMINAKKNVKVNCACGRQYTMNHKSRHYRTQIHIDLMENK